MRNNDIMKMNIRNIAGLFATAVIASAAFTSCEDEPDKYKVAGGVPEVVFVRTPANPDSVITSSFPNTTVVLVGNNLRAIKQLYFNDQQAVLNTSYMTDHTAMVTIPKSLPVTPTDMIYMVNEDGKTVTFPFAIEIDKPTLSSMVCEFVKPGEVATINGDYFLTYESDPMTITMPDGQVVSDFTSINQYTVSFVVPDGCTQSGPISVTTKYGSTKSTRFNFNDNRGLITDFDGTTDVVPQGWNIAAKYSSEGGVKGNYVELTGELKEDANWVESLKLPFWCGNWNGDPKGITNGAGVPISNIIDFSDWQNMAFKFELCIPSSNPWKAGALQVVFADYQSCANDKWQNNYYVKNTAGLSDSDKEKMQKIEDENNVKIKTDLCRGIYRPWADNGGSFDTAGKWITVTIPFKDFIYNYDGSKGTVPLSASSFDSFIMWINAGGVNGEECTPIVRYDNIRAVPYK